MNKPFDAATESAVARMSDTLARQKGAQLRAGPPDVKLRRDRLSRAIKLIAEHQGELIEAMVADFGARSRDMSLLTDIVSAIGPLKHARAHVQAWMAAQQRKVSPGALGLLGARAEVRFQPKGVVGVMTPWNFPVQLAFDAVAGAFAAGNRIMLKPSEFTPETSAAMARLVDLYFDDEEFAVFTGGPEIGAQFAGLGFDHLIFTGSTATGRKVMLAAAEKLTPVTLELGGKSPVVVGKSADLAKTAARVMNGKTLNAGQVCLAPDYVLAPRENLEALATAAAQAAAKMFPTLKDNPDYGAIISARHFERIKALIEDAREKGARIVEINPGHESFAQQEHRKIPPTLILDVTDEMKVMQEEIFGPVLPMLAYDKLEDAVSRINAGPRPLALYYFGEDANERETLLARTVSGGVTVNDVVFHFSQDELPFGGVGASGIGAYHGHAGFLEFSHQRAVYRQIVSEALAILRPPYGRAFRGQVAPRAKA